MAAQRTHTKYYGDRYNSDGVGGYKEMGSFCWSSETLMADETMLWLGGDQSASMLVQRGYLQKA